MSCWLQHALRTPQLHCILLCMETSRLQSSSSIPLQVWLCFDYARHCAMAIKIFISVIMIIIIHMLSSEIPNPS